MNYNKYRNKIINRNGTYSSYVKETLEKLSKAKSNVELFKNKIEEIKKIENPETAYNEAKAIYVYAIFSKMFVSLPTWHIEMFLITKKIINNAYKFAGSDVLDEILQLKKFEELNDELKDLGKEYNILTSQTEKLFNDAYDKFVQYKVGINYNNMDAPTLKSLLNDLEIEMKNYIDAQKKFEEAKESYDKSISEQQKSYYSEILMGLSSTMEKMRNRYNLSLKEIDDYNNSIKGKYVIPQTYPWMFILIKKVRSLTPLTEEEKLYLFPFISRIRKLIDYRMKKNKDPKDNYVAGLWNKFFDKFNKFVIETGLSG